MRLSSKTFIRYWLPIILMLTAIVIESTALLSGANTGRILDKVLRVFVPGVNPAIVNGINIVLHKTGHFLGYGFLTFLFFRLLQRRYLALHPDYEMFSSLLPNDAPFLEKFSILWRPQLAAVSWIAAVIIAVLDELHQMRIPSRDGSWWDVLLDSTAAAAVQILIYIANKRAIERAAKKAAGPLDPCLSAPNDSANAKSKP